MTAAPRSASEDIQLQPLDPKGPYHEAAVHVRRLLNAEFGAAATVSASTLIVRAISGEDTGGVILPDLSARLRLWGPMVADDGRFVSAPAMQGNRVVGILAAYSSESGRFGTRDLHRLVSY